MQERLQFYIDGAWVDPATPKTLDVINPATEEPCGRISLGSEDDVDRAVKAARAAFPAWSATSKEERLAVLRRIVEVYQSRYDEMVAIVSEEMGAPTWLSKAAQAAVFAGHTMAAIAALEKYELEEDSTRL